VGKVMVTPAEAGNAVAVVKWTVTDLPVEPGILSALRISTATALT